ncbi:MAG: hypothetical protein N4A72_11040 [Bacteroidales bacterium]|jgi:hypothetical protein|nr:hypothetical protein [Bacteroidales bacterium]
MKLNEYLSDGSFITFIPGQSSEIELNKTSIQFDEFLNKKGAESFVFVSYDDLTKLRPINSPEDEKEYNDSVDDSCYYKLNMTVGEQGWLFYLGGFKPYSNYSAITGLFILNVNEDEIKSFVSLAGYNWFVYGSKGESAKLVEWD